MSDNPIILDIDDALFKKRERSLKSNLQKALNQPFISFSEITKKYESGLYLVYDNNELLYIGMTYGPGKTRIQAIKSSFRKHTFNRKLVAQHFRKRGYEMHVLSIKNHKRDWIESGLISVELLKMVQREVNKFIKEELRFKFYEFNQFSLGFLEHYAIGILQPLYND